SLRGVATWNYGKGPLRSPMPADVSVHPCQSMQSGLTSALVPTPSPGPRGRVRKSRRVWTHFLLQEGQRTLPRREGSVYLRCHACVAAVGRVVRGTVSTGESLALVGSAPVSRLEAARQVYHAGRNLPRRVFQPGHSG